MRSENKNAEAVLYFSRCSLVLRAIVQSEIKFGHSEVQGVHLKAFFPTFINTAALAGGMTRIVVAAVLAASVDQPEAIETANDVIVRSCHRAKANGNTDYDLDDFAGAALFEV